MSEAIHSGARQSQACTLLGICSRTYQRWQMAEKLQEDGRIQNQSPVHNKLSVTVEDSIIETVNLPEYANLTPHEIVPLLLDKGKYIASESSFYRIMRKSKLLKHRHKSTSIKRVKPKPLQATGPNQIYTWDITYLMSPVKGIYYYLYLVMDLYSRKIVGWQVYDQESSALAAELMQDIVSLRQHSSKHA